MEQFKTCFDEMVELVFAEAASERSGVTTMETSIARMVLASMELEVKMDKFIVECFPHLETIHLKESPEAILDLLGNAGAKDLVLTASPEVRESFWELAHGMVKGSIVAIHTKREHNGTKYTKKYHSQVKVKSAAGMFEVEL